MPSSSFSLVTATHDALIATGDIKLIQNPALRKSTLALGTDIGRTVATVAANDDSQGRMVELRTARMLYHVEPRRPGARLVGDSLDHGWWWRVDFAAMQRDPEAVRAFQLNVYTKNNSIASRLRLQRTSADYRKELENELAAYQN